MLTEERRHRGTEAQMHRDTEAQRHRGTEAQRHRGTEAQRHRGTEIPKEEEKENKEEVRLEKRKADEVEGCRQAGSSMDRASASIQEARGTYSEEERKRKVLDDLPRDHKEMRIEREKR